MSKLVKVVIGLAVFTAIICTGQRDAGAIPIVLNDTAGPSEYFDSILIDPGSSYRFSFSYWTESVLNSSVPDGAINTDTFYYALINSNYEVLFDNSPIVDIANGTITPSVAVTQTFLATATDYFFIPYFLVGNGNSSFDATVYIDYELVKLESAPVPEPSTILLLGFGVLAYFGISRKRK